MATGSKSAVLDVTVDHWGHVLADLDLLLIAVFASLTISTPIGQQTPGAA